LEVIICYTVQLEYNMFKLTRIPLRIKNALTACAFTCITWILLVYVPSV